MHRIGQARALRVAVITVVAMALAALGLASPAAAVDFDGDSTLIGLTSALDVAVRSDGTVYVTDGGSPNSLSVFAPPAATAGSIVTTGSSPFGLAANGGYVYVANQSSGSVSRIAAGETEATEVINVGGGPLDIAFDSAGYLYVTDTGDGTNGTVKKYDLAVVDADLSIIATPVLETGNLAQPVSIAIHPTTQDVYVGTVFGEVFVYNGADLTEKTSEKLSVLDETGGAAAVNGLMFDTTNATHRLYASAGSRVKAYDPAASGSPMTAADTALNLDGLGAAMGITQHPTNGKIYVADAGGGGGALPSTVRVFLPGPALTTTPVPVAPATTTLDFSNVNINTNSGNQTITVENTGFASMAFSGSNAVRFAPGGTDNTQFTIMAPATTCGNNVILDPAETCNIVIRFNPFSALGQKTASLQLSSDAPGSIHSRSVTGKAVSPIFSPSQPNGFGDVVVNTSSSQVITITNPGEGALSVNHSVAISDPNFTLTSGTCNLSATITILPAQHCTLNANFVPASTGLKNATLTFTSNATFSGLVDPTPHTITLSGTGTTPVFSPSPSSKAFASTLADQDSATQTFTITNSGTAPLTFDPDAVTLTGTSINQFQIMGNTCSNPSPGATITLPTSGTCTVDVKFHPTSAGLKNASLRFADNANFTEPKSPQTLALSGTGLTTPTAPAAPAGVSAVAGNAQASVSWTAPGDNGGAIISGYRVQVATSSGGTYTDAGGTCAFSATGVSFDMRSCTATGLANGTTHYFKVAAKNVINMGTYSAASSGVTPVAPIVTPSPAGTTPAPAKNQTAACSLPKKIKRKGISVILAKACRTNAGQSVKVKVTGGKGSKLKIAKGKVTLTTRGKKVKLAITFSAPALTGYTAYSASKSYKI